MVSMQRIIYLIQLTLALVVHTLVSSTQIRKPNAGIQLVWECVSHLVQLHVLLLVSVDVLIMHLKIMASINLV